MEYNFNGLLEKYHILIPVIQRDFAQGRPTALELRTNFLSSLKKVLSPRPEEAHEPKLHLDFVYGYISRSDYFIPLDGQQRLTTLFLLHWYAAVKEGLINGEPADEVSNELKARLKRFSYETRVSSKRFCEELVDKPADIAALACLSDTLKDTPWFVSSWSRDPTITSMLHMLDSIHTMYLHVPDLWDNLISPSRITFEFIDIKSKEFKLTDELYIKMNSRGKPLTPFENFKAQLIDLFANAEYKNEKLVFNETPIPYFQYFAFKIDGAWMDLFWSKRDEIKTDLGIVNYLRFVSEMLYHRNENENPDFVFNTESLQRLYSKKENALFLFQSLDFLAGKDTRDFFNQIFCNNSNPADGLVRLFEDQGTDLFLRSISTAMDVRNRIVLYAVLYYHIHLGDGQYDRLRDYIRIIRNLTYRVNQVNTARRIEYSSNLRLPNFNEYSKFIHAFVASIKAEPATPVYQLFAAGDWKGFTKEVLEAEKRKASYVLKDEAFKKIVFALEDHQQIQGFTEVFDLDSANLKERMGAFFEVWDSAVNNSLIIRALLTYGDYAIKSHPNESSLGDIYYFGSKGYWNIILAADDTQEQRKIATILNTFLTDIARAAVGQTEDKLRQIIALHLSIDRERNWLYYFIKYQEITSTIEERFNLFSWGWGEPEGFQINSLGNSGKQPLSSLHINPYIITLHRRLNDDKKFFIHRGRFSDPISFMRIKGKIDVYAERTGWRFKGIKKDVVTEDMIIQYNLSVSDKDYILGETIANDRIENAILFCKALVS
jgi:hypothetical protein